MRKQLACVACVLVLGLPVHAALLNVQMLGRATDSKGSADPQPVPYNGPGALGEGDGYWNGVVADVFGQPLKCLRPLQMMEADGKTPTGVRVRFQGFTGADYWPASDGAPSGNALLNAYVVSSAPGATIEIEGLVPESTYDLAVFGSNSQGGAGAKFSVHGQKPLTTDGQKSERFLKGRDYVLFGGVKSDSSGRLRVTVDPGAAKIGLLNGFQLRGDFPPPGANPAESSALTWPVKMWLRAGDLQGLKPGDPVVEWKDHARGLRFSPNPTPPRNDKNPTFEMADSGGAQTPVVRFRGRESLRQLDGLTPVNEELSGFVIYRSSDDPQWKRLDLKRDAAFCIYSGGIATPRNPKLYYTVYNETGLRLGGLDNLPAEITGHQGAHNPDMRFRGDIAEMIVFSEQLPPDDPRIEATERYLHDKYLVKSDKPATAPWADRTFPPLAAAPAPSPSEALPAPSPTPQPSPVELAASADTADRRQTAGLDEVSIFSLKNQDHPAETEYAAGDVTLPFSYSARVSDAPRPECLNFPGQPNPDCSHVFVRIDGELWMFRIDWIAEKGRPSRWRGPDIDHMARVEDGTYPPEIGLGWFLGGMWYDEAGHKLYAPVHIEQEGSHRWHPAGGWFSRKIALCTSTDKGKTWKYEGDILTPETYFYTREVYKFSGSNNGNGVSDFGFYVDVRGGYFYIFPEESWFTKGEFGAMWGVRAARCKISDKMAPGKWSYFHNGKWDEPGLGGKSTMVAPSHFWGVIYSEYLGKYVCMFPSNSDPYQLNKDGVMIGTCTDLAKQDWEWGYCPEAMFGFMKLFNQAGTDTETCGQGFRYYGYFADNSFQRLDITLDQAPMSLNNWMPRYFFEPMPDSSDPILSRKTRIVGSASAEMRYEGTWVEKKDPDSFEGRMKQTASAGSSVEFSFKGADIYWRAIRSPKSGKADVFIDGEYRKTVDCYSPNSTATKVFVYLKTGLDPEQPHTIRVVAKGEKNPKSSGTEIGHIAFEYSALSFKASAGFSSVMGKNNWHYQQRHNGADSDMRFVPSDEVFVKDWFGEGASRVGKDYQIPDKSAAALRTWIAPRDGIVRIEGTPIAEAVKSGTASISIEHNGQPVWKPEDSKVAAHDLNVPVAQGDAVSFVVSANEGRDGTRVSWDPVLTYLESRPAHWKANPPSNKNLAFQKYARLKVLSFANQPFNAVDGDPSTGFGIYDDDRLSSDDDWLQVDLGERLLINRYVVVSKPDVPSWRPRSFKLQKSDDGFHWTEVDSVSNNTSDRVDRSVEPFTASHVRLYLPEGKPFFLNELELYNDPEKSPSQKKAINR